MEEEEKQEVQEYHERTVYIATLTMNRMKKELKEKKLKTIKEKERFEKTVEQCKRIASWKTLHRPSNGNYDRKGPKLAMENG